MSDLIFQILNASNETISRLENENETLKNTIESQRKENEKLIDENRILKIKLSRFKTCGSEECANSAYSGNGLCTNTTTLFKASRYCIECKPEDYEKIT